jgi:hypothetical protein
VVHPRIKGKFTAGPSGLTAEMLAVHEFDQPRYVLSGPALATDADADATGASATGEAEPNSQRITIGDVWDAFEARGLHPDSFGLGHAFFGLRNDRHLDMPNRGLMDWGTASDDLLAVLRTWGIQPVASGKYPAGPNIASDYATTPLGIAARCSHGRLGLADCGIDPCLRCRSLTAGQPFNDG